MLMGAVFLASLAMLVFYVLSGASTVDASSLQRDRSLLAQAVSEAKREMNRDQQTIAVNDEAVTRIRDGDLTWIEAHISSRMRQLFGHDRTYVLGSDDQPIYAMENGETVAAVRFDEIAGTVGPLVRRLRAQMDIGRYRTSNAVADIGTVGTLPAIIGVSAILRSGDPTERETDRAPLIVSTRSIDTKLLDGIGMEYMIPNIAFSPSDDHSPARASLELRTSRGKQIGFITWEQRRPGRRLMNETAPVMGGVFVLIVLLIAVLSERLRRSGSRLEASESHANHIAFHDSLTGLANRSQFHTSLNAMLDAWQADGRGFGLLCLDLDRFKEINDTLGHPAGDDLIRQVARRFQSVIGPRDLLARLSGDEFAILTPEISTIDALASRLIAVTNERFDLGGSPAWISVSIGGVPIADPALTGTEILRRADLALYQAKAMGRARSFIFDATLDALAREKRLLEVDLREALETGQGLSLAYQPLFGADLATIVGAEALIRWRHAERGNVSPADFIPIAEERGLVAALGEWVIREACRTLHEIDIPWIAVNVSPIQLKTAGFAAKAMAILE
ncbi:MAG: diguanylate cyclase, partial [Hyphomicrobiales bacterium]